MAIAESLTIFLAMLMSAMQYYRYTTYPLLEETRPSNVPTNQLYSEYDYIVIGAGSAGL